jgi:hypothetical protein
MRKFNQPHHILLATAVVFALIAVQSVHSSRMYDISLTDTYFVVSPFYVFGISSMIALLLWGAYFLLNKLRAGRITWIHVLASIALLIAIVSFIIASQNNSSELPGRYLEEKNDYPKILSILNYARLIHKALIAFFIIQIAFVLNIIWTYSRPRKLS